MVRLAEPFARHHVHLPISSLLLATPLNSPRLPFASFSNLGPLATVAFLRVENEILECTN